jgi:hypothetical protein
MPTVYIDGVSADKWQACVEQARALQPGLKDIYRDSQYLELHERCVALVEGIATQLRRLAAVHEIEWRSDGATETSAAQLTAFLFFEFFAFDHLLTKCGDMAAAVGTFPQGEHHEH